MSNLNDNHFKILQNSGSITSSLFNFCIKNNIFKTKFLERGSVFVDEILSDENIKNEYSQLKKSLDPNINLQINRWRGNFSRSEWEENCLNNLHFLLERKKVFKNLLKNL